MKNLILFSLCILPVFLIAAPPDSDPESLVVSFDEVVIAKEKLAFKAGRNAVRPSLSEFGIEYQRFLSNDLGHRFALVTLSKESALLRSISVRDIVGVLANGQRIYPIKLEGETHFGTRGSILVHFGAHPFPLVDLETRTE